MKILKRTLIIIATFVMLCVISVVASASRNITYGDLTYYVSNGGSAGVYNCSSSATEVVIPAEINGYPVTYIHSSAFKDCDALTSVTIPDSVTIIGDSAFKNCSALTSVTIPDGVTRIDDSAFKNCSALTSVTIPDGVTRIDDSAFEDCDALTSITIGNGIESIDNGVFYGCNSLERVYIENIESWLNISFGVSSSNPLTCGADLYLNGELLTELIIPDGVTSICSAAFYGCYALTSVTIPNSVTTIEGEAFYGCRALTSVTIPDSVTRIGGSAFEDCNALTSITIPDSVTSIGNYVFVGCNRLETVSIGSSVATIGDAAFGYCTKLTKVNWNAKNVEGDDSRNWGVFYSAGTHGDGIEFVFGDNVESIPAALFCDDNFNWAYASGHIPPNIKSVTISDSVTSIGDYAFHCSDSIGDIVYLGSCSQWELVEIGSNNNPLKSVKPNHEPTEILIGYDATCAKAGMTDGENCLTCHKTITLQELIPMNADNHTGETVIKNEKSATCTSTGYTGDTYCKGCDKKLETGTETDKIAHTEIVLSGKAATCAETGLTEGKKCSVCGTVTVAQTEIAMLAHTPGEWTILTASTITTEGVKVKYCTVCIAEVERESISAGKTSEGLSISYFGDINIDGIVATADARTILRCAANLEILNDTIVHLADVDSDGKVTTSDARLVLRMAANLDPLFYYSEQVHVHNYVSEITKQANCGSTGIKTYTCSVCGDTYTESIPIQGEHKYTSEVTKQANCGSTGIKTYTCSVCGYVYTEELPIQGEHSYNSSITKEATYNERGEITYTCYICNDKYTEETKALKEISKVYIHLPETPIIVSDYRINTIEHSFKLTEISYDVEKRFNDYKVIIYYGGEKTYDESGNNYSRYCEVAYKLYDMDGYVIESGASLTEDMKVGDKVKNQDIRLYDLKPGEYRLEILDTD